MGLSYEAWKEVCEALGQPGRIAEHPAASGRSGADILRELGVELPASGGGPSNNERRNDPIPARPRSPSRMNKTELAFDEMLWAGGIPHLAHALKFRIAGRTWYTPDFLALVEPWTFIEIKGFMRDDAAVKLKTAADRYPQFRWLLARRHGRNGWLVQEVTSRGIGTEPVHITWIEGS